MKGREGMNVFDASYEFPKERALISLDIISKSHYLVVSENTKEFI